MLIFIVRVIIPVVFTTLKQKSNLNKMYVCMWQKLGWGIFPELT